MNVRAFSFLAVSFALTCMPLTAQADARTGGGQQTASELGGAESALDAFHQALRSGDRNAALALLADGALIYESGHAEGKSEYAAHHLDADIAFAKAVPGTMVKRSGGLAGQFAWLTSEGRTTGTFKGKAVDRRTAETALLQSQGGKWLIVHLHWSSAAAE